jgi:hypothetical protein
LRGPARFRIVPNLDFDLFAFRKVAVVVRLGMRAAEHCLEQPLAIQVFELGERVEPDALHGAPRSNQARA